ncbi:CB1 cannabinoid receptor-interacting protein 1 [Ilyodon furcidens]|uniref:CB1 cannabinoid receptor-interacting protein 1 n=1 Tax=Ilyodon furcidens TaxID=33524 RepID=A0ABV0UL76_9TELE
MDFILKGSHIQEVIGAVFGLEMKEHLVTSWCSINCKLLRLTAFVPSEHERGLTGSCIRAAGSSSASSPPAWEPQDTEHHPGNMDDVPPIITIQIALRIQPNDGPVFFKVDGTRFGQSRTIKLLTGSKYKIEVVVKPGAVEATNMNIGGIIFPLEQQSRDEESVVYNGQYNTEGVPHTKSGDRQPVQVSIEFNKAGTFETVWQAKYYNYYKREHCQFGNKFSNIEYECKPNETRTLMWINKEAFN